MLKVGQKLWFVYGEAYRGKNHEATVVKVGNKWAELDNRLRIDKDTLVADPGRHSSAGRAHLDRQEWEAGVELGREWSTLQRKIATLYQPPGGLTADDIRRARDILFPAREAPAPVSE